MTGLGLYIYGLGSMAFALTMGVITGNVPVMGLCLIAVGLAALAEAMAECVRVGLLETSTALAIVGASISFGSWIATALALVIALLALVGIV